MTPEQREQARCTAKHFPGLPDDVRVAMFFPAKNEQVDDRAKAACAQCPVRRPCVEEATNARLPGYWGGTSGRDRKLEKRGDSSTSQRLIDHLYAHRGEWFATRDLADVCGRTRNTTSTSLAGLRKPGRVEFRQIHGGSKGSHGEWRVPALEATA